MVQICHTHTGRRSEDKVAVRTVTSVAEVFEGFLLVFFFLTILESLWNYFVFTYNMTLKRGGLLGRGFVQYEKFA